jgi:energy-coupling factor transporter ATP-binding protein EcfA2
VIPTAAKRPLVALEDVSKTYLNGTVALSGVDLAIRRPEFLSLLGPSGCGKSTILRLIAGLGDLTTGRIVTGRTPSVTLPTSAQGGARQISLTVTDAAGAKDQTVLTVTFDGGQDAGAVVIAGPRYDLPESSLAALREYWGKEGRLMVLLDPDADAPRLREFLASAGVTPRNDRVLRTVQLGFATGILRDVTGRFSPDNRVTRRLQGVDAMLPGGSCSLELASEEPGTVVEAMITAAEPFWGETKYVTDETKGVAFDEGQDTPAPLVLAAMVERGGVADEKVDVGAARMIVVGNSEFVVNGSITEPNLDFVLSSLNWMLDRSHLAGVSPKSSHAFNLNLTDLETGRIALYTLVVIPAGALVGGLFVWWRRRR